MDGGCSVQIKSALTFPLPWAWLDPGRSGALSLLPVGLQCNIRITTQNCQATGVTMFHSSLRCSVASVCLLLSTSVLAQDELAARQQAAATVADGFLQQLQTDLQTELANGPAEAATICRDIAPLLASQLSRLNGWQVTRVGTRVRNPLLGLPDAWERKVLNEFATRKEQGEDLATLTHGEVVEFEGRLEYHYMKAIGVQPACLSCHGSPEQIPQGVKDSLAQFYPQDQAVGYAIGDLRGAVSIRQPLEVPLTGE